MDGYDYSNESPFVQRELYESEVRTTKVWFYCEATQQYGWVRLTRAQMQRFDTGAIFSIGIDLDQLDIRDLRAFERLDRHFTTREKWAHSGSAW